MRILMCTPEFVPTGSGIAQVAYHARRALQKLGVDVQVLAPTGVGTSRGLQKGPTGILNIGLFWSRAIRYSRNHANEFDLVWFQQPLFVGPGTISTIRKPVVLTWHATYYGLYQAHLKYGILALVPYYLFARVLESIQLKRLSASKVKPTVTAVSPPAMKELQENGLGLPVVVVPHASRFGDKGERSKSEAREEIRGGLMVDLRDDDVVMISVGRVTSGKRPFEVLRFFSKMQTYEGRLKLVFIGTGALLDSLKREASRVSGAFVVGFVPDDGLQLFYQASDIFISLSPHEAFNLTAVEASSFGLPVVLSSIAAHRWLLESGRAVGMLVNDTTSPAEVIQYLRGTTSRQGASRRVTSSWSDVGESYLRLFERAIASGAADTRS